MKTLKMIAEQLKRIADSLMFIEITLLKINKLKYTDVEQYAEDYEEAANAVSETLEKYEGGEGDHKYERNRNY